MTSIETPTHTHREYDKEKEKQFSLDIPCYATVVAAEAAASVAISIISPNTTIIPAHINEGKSRSHSNTHMCALSHQFTQNTRIDKEGSQIRSIPGSKSWD